MTVGSIDFGYNPPTGERGLEQITPATFARDLAHALDIASQYFSSFWVSDHLMIGGNYRLEGWTQLAWIAARYPTQFLGTNVMCNSFRHPALLAKMAATLQVLSHGRLILGYGAGWVEGEYKALGIPYPSGRVRIEQMVEGIEVMRALWTQSPTTYEGAHYGISDAIGNPMPDPVPPVLIGGEGERYLLRAVAEHADIWLAFNRRPEVIGHKLSVLREHCTAVGRDPSTIRVALNLPVFVEGTHEAAVKKAGKLVDSENPAFAGSSEELVERLHEYADLGVSLFQLAFPSFPETDDLHRFAEEVLPAFR
ncbi:MAG: LLM class flavin-dependent oxidoreductase [Thermomicrobiales bacterium]|nr:LLM class flavin-dependent oxidoreductase [Thermomicrobiales bacterium]